MTPRQARRTSGRFVQTPVDLVLAFRARPRTAAVYALLARLCELTRGPVALSRDDLALLFDATRDDLVGVGIERAIRDLRASGWLIHTNQGQRGKRQLLVTWGMAATSSHAHGASSGLTAGGLPAWQWCACRWPCSIIILDD